MKHLITLSLLVVFSFNTWADTKQETGLWLGYFNNHEYSSKQSFWFETQLRHNLTQSQMNQTLVRFGILHTLNSQQKIGILGAYVDSDAFKEYRLAFQHQMTVIPMVLSLRQRLEFRDVEDINANSIRYRLLLRNEKYRIAEKQIVVWNEAFINLTHEEWTGSRVFERNRFFIGPKFEFQTFNLEVGYLNQFIPRTSRSTMEHLLTAYLFF